MKFIFPFVSIFGNFYIAPFLLSDLFILLFFLIFFMRNYPVFGNDDFLIFLLVTFFGSTALVLFILDGNVAALLSRLRFFFYAFLLFFFLSVRKYQSINFILIKSYLNFSLICSLFVCIQVVIYYSFSVVISFDFDSFNLAPASIDDQSLKQLGILRTGGFFREPSWYALALFPSLYFTYNYLTGNKRYCYIVIIILGLLLSSSTFAYLIFAMTIILIALRTEGGLAAALRFSGFCLFIFPLLYFSFPDFFYRLNFVIETGGSFFIRVVDPFISASKIELSFFGMSESVVYERSVESNWTNSLVYIYYLFGLFGVMIFIILVFYFSGPVGLFFTCTLLVFEGAIGRPEFWLVLLILCCHKQLNVIRCRFS